MHSYSPFLDWIDPQRPTLLQRVKQWVGINSFSLNINGLDKFLVSIHSAFKILNGECTYCDLAPQKMLGPNGSFYFQPLGRALVIRKRSQAPIQVLLGGHIDTVYPPSHSFQS